MIVTHDKFIAISQNEISTEKLKIYSTNLTDEQFRIIFNRLIDFKPVIFYLPEETAAALPEDIRNHLQRT